MSEFDQRKAYAAQETLFVRPCSFLLEMCSSENSFDYGREEELVDFVTNHPEKANIKGSPPTCYERLTSSDEPGSISSMLAKTKE